MCQHIDYINSYKKKTSYLRYSSEDTKNVQSALWQNRIFL